MFLGRLRFIDYEKNELRVEIFGIHSSKLKSENYPISLLMTPLPNIFFQKLKKDMIVAVDFIMGDENQPIILGFPQGEWNNDLTIERNLFNITFLNANLGIHFIEDGENIKVKIDGDILLPTTDTHYSLLAVLNDIQDILQDMKADHLGHIHDAISAGGTVTVSPIQLPTTSGDTTVINLPTFKKKE